MSPRRAVGYAYPWDFLGDKAAADRVRALGVDAVAVAAGYHTTRAASPLHPTRRLLEARHAACYLPVRPSAWRGRLRPVTPSWLDTDDSFLTARAALRPLPVDAWIVFTHNSLLGTENPDLVVRNAFGERYPYALCPSAPEVAEYCVTLAAEVVSIGEPDGVVLEACGPLGLTHGGHHDKTDLADWTAEQERLLSLCFCASCATLHTDAGLDGARIAALVRAALAPGAQSAAVATAAAAPLARLRATVTAELRRRVVMRLRSIHSELRVTVHAAADVWATGPFASVAGGVEADCLVANCWQDASAVAGVAALRGAADSVGGYLRADASWTPQSTVDRIARYRDAGMTEAHLYHLGLVGERGLSAMSAMVAAMDSAAE